MKIWIRKSLGGMPLLHLSAEDKGDVAYLNGLKQQLDEARESAELVGLSSDQGETCAYEVGEDGFKKLTIPLLLGEVEMIKAGDGVPPQRDKMRLIARRNPGGRRLSA